VPTLSDAYQPRRGRDAGDDGGPVLRVVLAAHAPHEPGSRHRLDEVRTVSFGRGERAAVRAGDTLTLRLPDPMMSSDHGRLRRVEDGWLLEDPRSKNGAMVAGRPTRCAPIAPDDLFELGHTLFELADEPRGDGPLDLRSDELRGPSPALVTFDPALARSFDHLARVAPSEVPVLLVGASGTGKEVCARALHALSGRRGTFVAVNCGGLAPALLEAELFGHRKGAFTGALADRVGYVRAADGGTLFLDELGDLSRPAQAALLRVLQEREVAAVGDSTPVAVDFRVCAATHRDPTALVAAGALREDLYARLLGVTLTLPPLRARRGDLGLLIGRLLARLPGGERARFTPAAAYALVRHAWPLNVRELERTLAAALAIAGDRPIDPAALPAALALPVDAVVADDTAAPTDDGDDATRAALVAALVEHRGNVTAAARALGKHREQVHRWARRFAIDLAGFRR